jgi:hypothetical protein
MRSAATRVLQLYEIRKNWQKAGMLNHKALFLFYNH